MTLPEAKLSVANVVAAIDRELAGAPAEAVPPRPRPGLAPIREAQHRFRAEPVGGRLARLKRLVYWFTASAFDRQAKVVEALIDELDAERAARERLAERLAELEARLSAAAGGRNGEG